MPAFLASSLSTLAGPVDGHLVDGFDGTDFSPAGGLYYRENNEQAAGTVEFQDLVKRTGTGALKLSVRPNCPAGEENCSERAEIWEKTSLREPYDKGVWYGFAVKLAEPIPVDDHRYLIAQWKREIDPGADGDFSPFLALRLKRGRLFATVETNYQPPESELTAAQTKCMPAQTPVWPRPNVNQMRALVATDRLWTGEDGDEFVACTSKIEVISRGNALPPPDEGWIDFAILTKPGPDGTGHIEIFANNKWIATVKGYIGHNDKGLGENQYFKFGPYRAANSNEWTVYYDDFRRSQNCEDVLADKAACAAVE
ncbi:polysaccharide lyase [Ferirhizobium litorale]|uniref:polysaccharide lyase n=1 Tax=Ferirhizobium litorale TaxID=2927786 RepID=UPI00353010C2